MSLVDAFVYKTAFNTCFAYEGIERLFEKIMELISVFAFNLLFKYGVIALQVFFAVFRQRVLKTPLGES